LNDLQYKTPEHLMEAVGQLRQSQFSTVLDLGCGTGLCGAVFQAVSGSLVGVDLSSEMIAVAERRGIYEQLHVAGIVDFLDHQSATFDLILAADVFVYVGDLDDIFRLVSKALNSTGLFAFSVEAHSGESWVLGPSRRYSHGLPYLQQLAAVHGLIDKSAKPVVLRVDSQVDVHGWVIVLEKRA
jgi:predicted TPR repeat methyltransferase